MYPWIDVCLFHCLAIVNRDVQISLCKEIVTWAYSQEWNNWVIWQFNF